MSSDLIRYKGYLYGHQKHKEVMTIIMDIPISSSCHSETQWQKALGGILRSTLREIKHSGAWNCFHCGELAHETINNPVLYLPGTARVPRPLVIDQIFFVCRDGGECRAVIDAECKQIAATVLKTQHKDLSPAGLRAGETRSKEPLAATCANCLKGGKVMKCGKCKMIRYCSRECQKADYSRHKIICAMIKKVESNPESNDLTAVFD